MEEKRRFFRIDDSLAIAFRVIGDKEAEVIQQGANYVRPYDFAANFDNRIASLLEACKIQSPIAAELIDLINKKLNFMIRHMDLDAAMMHEVAYELNKVNISACGMAFATKEKLAVGQQLQLDMQLQEADLAISLLAKVVASEMTVIDDEQHHFVRLNFEYIHSHDQELLIQHIVKRQGVQIRQRQLSNDEQE